MKETFTYNLFFNCSFNQYHYQLLKPIPTKAYRNGRENKTLEESYGEEFTELGVTPFYRWPLIPLLRGSIIQLHKQRPWQGLFPAGGKGVTQKKGTLNEDLT